MTAYSRTYTNSTSTKGERKKPGNRAESQMKERGSGPKTTCNEFMEPVLEIHYMVRNILLQCLVHPPSLAVPD